MTSYWITFPSTNIKTPMIYPHASSALHRRRLRAPVSLRSAVVLLTLMLLWTAALADSTIVDCGQISGLWTRYGSPYIIRGDLEIAVGDTLRIGSGVTIDLRGAYAIIVRGTLLAIGNDRESIVFTTDTATNPAGWKGLRVLGAGSFCHLEYSLIENGCCLGQNDDGLGGALMSDRGYAEIANSEIRGCRAVNGGGIYARNYSTIMLSHTFVRFNEAGSGCGGGICCRNGTLLMLRDCDIRNNSALYGAGLCLDGTTTEITESRIAKNETEIWGGGMFCSAARITISDSRITGNSSTGGGGIDGREVTLTMDRCVISDNTTSRPGIDGTGGAMTLLGGEHTVTNCTIVRNTASQGSAIYGANQLRLVNSIVAGNQRGRAIYFIGYGAEIGHSCFIGNTFGDFAGGFVPANLGAAIRVNSNGDSCDASGNIFTDPLFDDSADTEFTLSPGSPCIDAGDPHSPLDPDGSIADMGAYWFARASAIKPTIFPLPRQSALHPAFPNPFNPATMLAFDLPQAARVSLRVFDLMGREAAVLADENMSAGHYEVQWNAADFSAGTYFAVLETSGIHSVQKLLLLK